MSPRDRLLEMRAALIEARANGLRRVRDSNGAEVQYESDREIAEALRSIDAELAATRPSVIYFNTSRGLK